MGILRTVRSLPRGKKTLLWAGIALLLYTLFGFLAAPPILKYFLTKNLSETLHREVRICFFHPRFLRWHSRPDRSPGINPPSLAAQDSRLAQSRAATW
jgi:hypothetical protein